MSDSVLVLGAGGALGSMTADQFEKAGWEVFRGARRRLASPRYRHVDFDRPDTVEAACEGVDLIVNTVDDHAMRAEDVVLARGGTLFNIAAGPVASGARLRRRSAPDAAGRVVLHGGLVPGVTSLVFTDLLAAHPEADLLEMVWTFTGQGYSGVGGRRWAHSYIAARSHSAVFNVPLPPPYGIRACMELAEDENGWLPPIPGVRVRTGVCFYERDTDLGFRMLNRLRLRKRLPSRMIIQTPKRLTRGGKPGEGTAPPGACTYWVAARRGDRVLGARTIEGEDDYLVTALSAVAFAEALLRKGAPTADAPVSSVEDHLELDDVLPRLRELGVSVVDR
jgi:hypothetical protein